MNILHKIRSHPGKPNQRKASSWTFRRGIPEQKFEMWIVLVFPRKNTRIHKNGWNSWTFRFAPFFGLVCRGDSWQKSAVLRTWRSVWHRRKSHFLRTKILRPLGLRWLELKYPSLAFDLVFVGNRPNTVSESTVSNTELSEFYGPHRVPGRISRGPRNWPPFQRDSVENCYLGVKSPSVRGATFGALAFGTFWPPLSRSPNHTTGGITAIATTIAELVWHSEV